MNDLVKKRIDKYLRECGENGNNFIVIVEAEQNAYKCTYCGNSVGKVTDSYKPNFCSECGCLLDWSDIRETE